MGFVKSAIIIRNKIFFFLMIHNSISSSALLPSRDILCQWFLDEEINRSHSVAIDYTIISGREIAYNLRLIL